MKYEINGKLINVIIEKKNNKNTYIRVKDVDTILITTNYFVTKSALKKLLDDNKYFILKALDRKEMAQKKSEEFYYLGNRYDIITVPTFENVELTDDKIYVKDIISLEKWCKKQIMIIFKERLDYCFNLVEEKIPYPKLKIRLMKTRWGVCNRKDNSVTLNTRLIEYSYDVIDYVIFHELSHFIHFDHSHSFWLLVEKYCPNYKLLKKKLRD